ncbi:hypothetical protein EC991_004786 [Linnemannia zychae]|nr:hypothetical protein EC991_004786 [Linnemannia zychae]
MVGPSMRPPRSISGSSSAAAAAAVAMAMATVANARLSASANGALGGGGGGCNFEGGPLDQDGNPIAFRNASHHNHLNHNHQADDRNSIRMAANGRMEDYQTIGMLNPLWATRAGLSARGPDATGSRSVDLPIVVTASSQGHRKLHGYSSPSPTIPTSSRGIFSLSATSPSIYSPTDPLSGHARTQQSPPLTITTSRYVSAPTPGVHEIVPDPKRVAGYDYFNLPLTQSAASTPSVTSPSFTTHARSFAQLSLLDDASLSASLPPTPTQTNFEKYGDGLDPSSLYKAPVPLYPTQNSQTLHRPSGQPTPLQHKQLRTSSISPHLQSSRDTRHQPFGLADRRSSLPWDARISSYSGPLDSRGGGPMGGSRQQHGSSTPSASTGLGYKGRERHSLPQSFLVRSNSTPAIFGLPSTSMTSLEQHQQQQQHQQAHFNAQQGWHAMRPKVEGDMGAGTTPSTLVERITPQDLITATGGHCSSPFDRTFHNSNSQGQVMIQDIQESARGSIPSNVVVPRQQQDQIRLQRISMQDGMQHQQQQQHYSGDPWAPPAGLDSFDSNMSNKDRTFFGSTDQMQITPSVPRTSGSPQDMPSPYSYSSPPDTQIHRPTNHPLAVDAIDRGRNDAASQQQHQTVQHQQNQHQSSQHAQHHPQHPLPLKVEDLDDETFDSSLAMVVQDHLSLMDHLNMMPDVEVYQNEISAAASLIRSAEHPPQQVQKIEIPSSGPTGVHPSQHQYHPHRLQGPMSAPVISAHHQNLFGSDDLYSAATTSSTTASSSGTTVRPNGCADMSESSISSPVSPEGSTATTLGSGSGGMVMIKQEFGAHPAHTQTHHHQHHEQHHHPMLYFDNNSGTGLVLNNDSQNANSSNGSCNEEGNGGGNNGSYGNNGSFGYVQNTSFMHIKTEPDIDLDNQHLLQKHHQHQQHASSSLYTMDRQHPFDATPVQQQYHHQHHHHHHQHQGGRLNQSTSAAPISTAATAHGVPILVAEYSHRPHQQQQQ